MDKKQFVPPTLKKNDMLTQVLPLGVLVHYRIKWSDGCGSLRVELEGVQYVESSEDTGQVGNDDPDPS